MTLLRPCIYVVLSATAAGCTSSNLDVISRAPSEEGGSSANETCPSKVLDIGDTKETVQIGASTREYFLHVPVSYDGQKPVPLVVDFHALTGTGERQRGDSPYPIVTDPEGVIMAFPSGAAGPSGSAWNLGPCCVANVDDVAFVRAMVEKIQTTACIDKKRIYAVGWSIGGGMAYQLACHAADLFAAVAPASFDLLEENVGDCKPANPITVIAFRGTADPLEPYDGGASSVVPGMPVTFLGAKRTFQTWAALDHCTDSPSPADINGCSTYSACEAGVEVVLCTKQGGGLEAGNANLAWPVLKRHKL